MVKAPDATGIGNLVLAGTSAYSLYCINPKEYPYAYTACAIGFCQGLIQFSNSILDDGIDEKFRNIATGVMELVPLPLVNIELYNISKTSHCLGLAHGFFIIPLALYLGKKLFDKEEGEDENVDTLRNMTILGNIVSLLFLSVNDDKCVYCTMAISAFIAQYGSKLVEKRFEGWGGSVFALGYSVYNYLTGVVLGDF